MRPARQVDTFQFSCLTAKDIGTTKYTDFVTVVYANSMNGTGTTLACPSSSQFLVINSVSPSLKYEHCHVWTERHAR